MSKELPYFKFFPSEWLMGDIVLLPYSVQGVFTNVKAYYWQKECKVTLAMLKQKFSNAIAELNELIKSDILKHDSTSDEVTINFLDEQFSEISELHEKRVKAGRKGGKAKLKQNPSKAKAKPKHKEEEKEEEKDITFDKFWSLYPKKVGRKTCLSKWEKLTLEIKNKIIETLPAFSAYKPFPEYTHPNPETYFNQERWWDEIPEVKLEKSNETTQGFNPMQGHL